jgi:hypothetical protein
MTESLGITSSSIRGSGGRGGSTGSGRLATSGAGSGSTGSGDGTVRTGTGACRASTDAGACGRSIGSGVLRRADGAGAGAVARGVSLARAVTVGDVVFGVSFGRAGAAVPLDARAGALGADFATLGWATVAVVVALPECSGAVLAFPWAASSTTASVSCTGAGAAVVVTGAGAMAATGVDAVRDAR